ncbi:hypothetical protein QYF36_008338 [Acer negundo]|nr:hypothetical protein QYF36_008338 [Acer negundo]
MQGVLSNGVNKEGWRRNDKQGSGGQIQDTQETLDKQYPQSDGMEADKQGRVGEQVSKSNSDDRICFKSEGKGAEITKRKGTWKRWAREGRVRDIESRAGDVEGRGVLIRNSWEGYSSIPKMDEMIGCLARCVGRLQNRMWITERL